MKVNFERIDATSPREEKSLPPLKVEPVLSAEKVKFICYLIAGGESLDVVKRNAGVTQDDLDFLLATPKIQDTIVRMQAEMTPDPKARIKKLAHLAIDVQTRLLLNPKTPATVVAGITKDILDRDMGKAIQVTENRNINYDLKDSAALDRALMASAEKLKRIEDMQKKLAIATPAKVIPITDAA